MHRTSYHRAGDSRTPAGLPARPALLDAGNLRTADPDPFAAARRPAPPAARPGGGDPGRLDGLRRGLPWLSAGLLAGLAAGLLTGAAVGLTLAAARGPAAPPADPPAGVPLDWPGE